MSIVRNIRFSSKNERKAFISTVIIFLLLLLMLYLIKLSTSVKEQFQGGIIVDFGTTETGLGTDNTQSAAPAAAETPVTPQAEPEPSAPEAATAPAPAAETPDLLTQERESVALERKKAEEDAKKRREEAEARKKQQEEEARKRREAEAAARAKAEAERKRKEQEAFAQRMQEGLKGVGTGRNDGTASGGGEGQTRPGDNEGSPDGSPGAPKGAGTGQGTEGLSFDLRGRDMIGRPSVKNEEQKSGRVVVQIKVDRNGQVIDATFRQSGSTTNDSYLVGLSIQAAKRARFNRDENAADEQFGTITFNYKIQK